MSAPAAIVPHWRARLWAGLAVFTLLVMESTVTALWYQAIFARREPAYGTIFGVLFAILTGSYLIPRGMEALRWKTPARYAVTIAWILAAGFGSLKALIYPTTSIQLGMLLGAPVLFILRSGENAAAFFHLMGIILWIWRGVALARYPLGLGSAQASFQLGLVSILLYGMFYAPLYPGEAVVGLYVYLFCGLTTMSLSRIANLSETRGGRVPRFGLGWLGSIAAAGLAVVGLAILVGWASSGQVVEWVTRLFIIVVGILTAIVLLILSPLFLWLGRLLPALADLINQLLDRFRGMPVFEQAAEWMERIVEGLERLAPYARAGRGFALAGILLALVLGVLLTLYLRRALRALVEEEASERADAVPGELTLRKLLLRLLSTPGSGRLRSPAQLLAAARIRRIYRQLMQLSQKLGLPRPPSATPLEFLPQLAGLFPTEEEALERITGAYVSVRYGNYPESAEEVAAIQAAWERVRRQGRKQR